MVGKPILRSVLDGCADCDTCRFLMEDSCLLFPELYRLYDQEKEDSIPISNGDLRRLSELCTLCGLCPCPDIRAGLIRGKTERVQREGLRWAVRLLADPERLGRWSRLAPKIVNRLLSDPMARLVKKCLRIHPHRVLPRLAGENFFTWARRRGLDREPQESVKVAYFAGCTAAYLFPEVAKAAVAVLARSGVGVHVPPQQCCGMPTLLEGDRRTTVGRARFNLESMRQCLASGYEPVCSCPSCGFLMKILLKEGAVYSPAYQQSVRAGKDEIKLPGRVAGREDFICLKKSIYPQLLTDNGYFSELDPLARIRLADSVMDIGAYLSRLHGRGALNSLDFKPLKARMVYFAPCHQREQGIGSPYENLLALIPGLSLMRVGGAMDCCGMGGNLGFKEDFHEASMTLGRPLMGKIRAAAPEAIVTDCLSCRLQFTQALPYQVFHPLEILSRSFHSHLEKERDR